jgi:hypothetical protein
LRQDEFRFALIHHARQALHQLFAQQQVAGGFVCTASYGDGVTGYIPLEQSFIEGGYEPSQAYAAPDSEKVMKQTISDLLKK